MAVLQDRKSRLTQVRSLMSTVEDGAASGVGADLRAARERRAQVHAAEHNVIACQAMYGTVRRCSVAAAALQRAPCQVGGRPSFCSTGAATSRSTGCALWPGGMPSHGPAPHPGAGYDKSTLLPLYVLLRTSTRRDSRSAEAKHASAGECERAAALLQAGRTLAALPVDGLHVLALAQLVANVRQRLWRRGRASQASALRRPRGDVTRRSARARPHRAPLPGPARASAPQRRPS